MVRGASVLCPYGPALFKPHASQVENAYRDVFEKESDVRSTTTAASPAVTTDTTATATAHTSVAAATTTAAFTVKRKDPTVLALGLLYISALHNNREAQTILSYR